MMKIQISITAGSKAQLSLGTVALDFSKIGILVYGTSDLLTGTTMGEIDASILGTVNSVQAVEIFTVNVPSWQGYTTAFQLTSDCIVKVDPNKYLAIGFQRPNTTGFFGVSQETYELISAQISGTAIGTP